MKRTWLTGIAGVLAAVAGLSFPAAANEDVIQSAWANAIPKIDGSGDDWTDAVPGSWEKGRITCAFRNNAESLYVLLVVGDPKLRSTIEATGVTLYFSTAGKDKDYGVHFIRKTISAEEAIAIQEKRNPLSEEQKNQMRTQPSFILFFSEVVNKKAGSPPPPDGTAGRPALFRYAPQQKSLVYEFVIPLQRNEEWAAGVGVGLGQTVEVGFEWGGMTEEMRKMAARRQGGSSNIANERIGGMSSKIVPESTSGRVPAKHAYWGLVKLAAGGN